MSRSQMKYHPRLGFTYMPSSKMRVPGAGGGYLVRTNAAGFRSDREFVAEREPGTYRALMFGDSQTAGDGAANAFRFSDLIENDVSGLEIYNYGLSGSGPGQQFLAYQEFGNVDHDLLVICLYVENIRRVTRSIVKTRESDGAEAYYAKPYYELDAGELALRNVPVPKKGWTEQTLPAELRSQIYNYSETNFHSRDEGTGKDDDAGPVEGLARSNRLAPVRKAVKNLAIRISKFEPLPDYDAADSPPWVLLRQILETWLAASDTPVLLVPLPHYVYFVSQNDTAGYHQRFNELAAAAGCHLYDPLADLWKLSASERNSLWSDASGHLSLRGHEVVAGLLGPVIAGVMAAGSEGHEETLG